MSPDTDSPCGLSVPGERHRPLAGGLRRTTRFAHKSVRCTQTGCGESEVGSALRAPPDLLRSSPPAKRPRPDPPPPAARAAVWFSVEGVKTVRRSAIGMDGPPWATQSVTSSSRQAAESASGLSKSIFLMIHVEQRQCHGTRARRWSGRRLVQRIRCVPVPETIDSQGHRGGQAGPSPGSGRAAESLGTRPAHAPESCKAHVSEKPQRCNSAS